MCKYCEYKDDYEWLLSMDMGKVNPYLDMRISTRISPALNKLSLSVSTETDDDEQIITDLPINYCPVCGRAMGMENKLDQLGGADMVARKILDVLTGITVEPTPQSKPEPEPLKYVDAIDETFVKSDWLEKKKASAKLDVDHASVEWDAFFDMAVEDIPIPDHPRLRVRLYNVGVQILGNSPATLAEMTNKQIYDTPKIGPALFPWIIKLRDYAKEVC